MQRRPVQGQIELVYRSSSGGQAGFEHGSVVAEHLPGHRRVAGFQHLPDGFEGHVELPQAPDNGGIGQLADGI
jgi:hypothetical protein